MYINPKSILGATFQPALGTDSYVCIGYGQSPSSPPYIIGMWFDRTNNRTEVKSFLLKDIKFMGKLPDPDLTV
jgi:hypothetical protein